MNYINFTIHHEQVEWRAINNHCCLKTSKYCHWLSQHKVGSFLFSIDYWVTYRYYFSTYKFPPQIVYLHIFLDKLSVRRVKVIQPKVILMQCTNCILKKPPQFRDWYQFQLPNTWFKRIPRKNWVLRDNFQLLATKPKI